MTVHRYSNSSDEAAQKDDQPGSALCPGSALRIEQILRSRKNADASPGLLISVRDCEEAEIAIAGGADLIDIKEPLHGPLGAADRNVLQSIADRYASRAVLSAAMGELADWNLGRFELPAGFQFAKFGLARCNATDWQRELHRAFSEMSPEIGRVAVAYADWRLCEAPSPEEVIRFAIETSAAAILFDTFHKDGTDLLDHLNESQLTDFIQQAEQSQTMIVLAGSLRGERLETVAQLSPDYVAVRGAVCVPNRNGAITLAGVSSVKSAIGNVG